MIGFLALGTGLASGQERRITLSGSQVEYPRFERSFALIVGVGNYTAGWRPLRGIRGELDNLEDALREHGFETEKIFDPDGQELRQAFESFIEKYGYDPHNRLLFFFAGHGQTGYLVPADAPLPAVDGSGLRRKALSIFTIGAWAQKMGAGQALFLFDSCLSGPVFQSQPRGMEMRVRGSANLSREFIASCGAGEAMPPSSVFVPYLIRALDGAADPNGDGILTARDLAAYLERKLEPDQALQYGRLHDGSFGLDYVFRLPGTDRPPAAEAIGRVRHTGERPEGVLPKVVGLSDNIPIVGAPGSTRALGTMETLRHYFVIGKQSGYYRISPRPTSGKGEVPWFVAENSVTRWDTREGLRFVAGTLKKDLRDLVGAWESKERLKRFADSGDEVAHGSTFGEDNQTRVGSRKVMPYPLLGTEVIRTAAGETRRIHEVLIPAFVPSIETDLEPDAISTVVGAVTFCIVFDATRSMRRYARDFADTVNRMLKELHVDAELAAAGFILYRDLGNAPGKRTEIAAPMPLPEATQWLRQRASSMMFGDDPEEPVLDAVTLARIRFNWNGGSATRNAKRIVILVANEGAKLKTVALNRYVPPGLDKEDVARRLMQPPIPISVYSLQAGPEDHGNLVDVLRTLSEETGGEFYPATRSSESISDDFSRRLARLLTEREGDRAATLDKVKSGMRRRKGGGTVIELDILDEDVKRRLQASAAEFNIVDGGLRITKAWVFEEPALYREVVLVEKDLLSKLVRHFTDMADSAFDSASLRESTAQLLTALTGDPAAENAEVQQLVEQRLGIHFKTSFLSHELDQLINFSEPKRLELEAKIRDSTAALADFIERNNERFDQEHRIWMPVSLLP